MKKGLFVAGLVMPSLVFSTTNTQNYKIHILKQGETLSQLLQTNNFKPIYGKNNWLTKVLKMNHLTVEAAKTIKKGYPIILPKRTEIASQKKDIISYKMSSNKLYGIVGNTISKHQDIYLDFALYEMSSKLNNQVIKQYSNFKAGFTYEDKNNRTFKNFTYAPVFSLYGIGHGPVEFEDNYSQTATFEPTIQGQTSLLISHPSMSYKFGPYAEILERSQLERIENNTEVRRDRFINVGAIASQRFEIDHLVYDIKASIGSTVLSDNLNSYENMSMVTTKLSADVNLTKDYYVGAFWNQDYFRNTSQRDANSFGLNLKYFVK